MGGRRGETAKGISTKYEVGAGTEYGWTRSSVGTQQGWRLAAQVDTVQPQVHVMDVTPFR